MKKSKDIVLLTGLRRVGKTTLLKQIIMELLKTEKPEHIFYISLDSVILEQMNILEIVDKYREIMNIEYNIGVDAISVGALTHSAPAADISLKLL